MQLFTITGPSVVKGIRIRSFHLTSQNKIIPAVMIGETKAGGIQLGLLPIKLRPNTYAIWVSEGRTGIFNAELIQTRKGTPKLCETLGPPDVLDNSNFYLVVLKDTSTDPRQELRYQLSDDSSLSLNTTTEDGRIQVITCGRTRVLDQEREQLIVRLRKDQHFESVDAEGNGHSYYFAGSNVWTEPFTFEDKEIPNGNG